MARRYQIKFTRPGTEVNHVATEKFIGSEQALNALFLLLSVLLTEREAHTVCNEAERTLRARNCSAWSYTPTIPAWTLEVKKLGGTP